MDDNIIRNFHWATGEIALWWGHVYPIISSADAMRFYALIALAAITAGTACRAYRAKRKLTALKTAAIKLTFPGPDPIKEASKKNRCEALKERARNELKPFRRTMWILLLTGFVVPTFAFTIGTINYSWLNPSGLPFLSLAENKAMQSVSDSALVYFTLNQFSHGALFDVFEVFDIDLVAISNNPHDYWFSGAVLIYRSMVSAFVVALAIAIAQFIYVKMNFRREIKKEMKRFGQIAAQASTVAEAA